MTDITIDGHRIGVLFSDTEIASRVKAIAIEIAALKPANLLVVPILKGSFVFAADLIRAMHHAGLSPEVDFMILSSYRKSQKSSGQVNVLRDIETDVKGRDVLLIDDILKIWPYSGVCQGSSQCPRRQVDTDCRAAEQTRPSRRPYIGGFPGIRLPGQIRRRLRHGYGAPIS